MIVYLNGEFVPVEEARISVLDRGFLFGDGVYEGLRTFAGRVYCGPKHVARLAQGLAATGIDADADSLEALCEELARKNDLPDAFIYVQYTRGAPLPGAEPRSRIPDGPTRPTVFAMCVEQGSIDQCASQIQTLRVQVCEDQRWLNGRIKSISLLGNIMAAMEGHAAGADEALLARGPLLAEATSSNVILALPRADGSTELVTPSLDSVPILAGVTRARLLELEPAIVERAVGVDELASASEVMVCGTTSFVSVVTHVDGRPVGDGVPGPEALRLLELYINDIRRELALPDPACPPARAAHG